MVQTVIIGGGLAGLTLAVQEATAGRAVVVLEKETYPFHKVCGEYVSRESADFLIRLGVPLADLNLPVITRLTVTAPDGTAIQRPLGLGGIGVSRFFLDQHLANLVRQRGGEVREGVRVTDVAFAEDCFTLETSAGPVRARVVAGAWGRRANLDVKLARPHLANRHDAAHNYVAVKHHLRLPDFPPDLIELHNFRDGYAGLSRVEDGRTCMAYLTTAANLKRAGSIAALEATVLAANPALAAHLRVAELLIDPPLTISQVTFNRKAPVENHLLLLGDAAGTIAPLCGNGMSMGMHAAHVLHGLLTAFYANQLTRPALETAYTRAWDARFRLRIFAGRTIQRFFGQPALTSAVIRGLRTVPWVADALVGLTHGKPF
ncbi:MAG: FAD-dependent monooxygenase [Hymenobacteraceae bacterium]|nr:FAD-dependent monooxygenase [Hymenobacteraceae bacterium]